MIVFSHANSYGAGTYRRLLVGWRKAGQEVVAVDRFAHRDGYTVDARWHGMTKQLVDLIDAQSEPRLWLVGHSMGGYISLLAAGQRPHRVRGIVLLDSPIVSGWRAGLVSLLKATGRMERIPPASVAMTRRDHWPSLGQVHQHFVGKPLFAAWHPDVLRDYVKSGTERNPAGGGRRLSFRPEIESALYASVPHDLMPYVRNHPPGGPVAFIGGRWSNEIRQVGLAATRRLVQDRMIWMEGSHLFPFEKPDETVKVVLDCLRRLDQLE